MAAKQDDPQGDDADDQRGESRRRFLLRDRHEAVPAEGSRRPTAPRPGRRPSSPRDSCARSPPAGDALTGRYIHAEHDDIDDLIARAEEIRREDLSAIRLRR